MTRHLRFVHVASWLTLLLLLFVGLPARAQTTYLGGTLRNFQASHPDFNRPVNSDDLRRVEVEDQLGPDGKPVLRASDTNSSIQSAASFAEWWSDVPGINLYLPRAITLTSVAPSNQIISFQSKPYFPLDGLLFGNQGGEHNDWFTYHLRTTVTVPATNPPLALTFGSTDDLFVFANNILVTNPIGEAPLSGIHTYAEYTIVFNSTFLAEHEMTNSGFAYVLDIFYAHRSSLHPPALRIETTAAELRCFAPDPNIIPLDHVTPLGSALTGADGSLQLVSDQTPEAVGGVFLTSPIQVSSELRTTFDFRMTPQPGQSAEGLAFVLAADPTLGQGASGLGYAGIPNSLAVELDTHTDPEMLDPPFNSGSIHTLYEQPNSAGNEAQLPPLIVARPSRMDDGNWHEVAIDLIDYPSDKAILGLAVDGRYVAAGTLLDDEMARSFFVDHIVYPGIVSSNGPGAQATVEIANWTISTLTPEPLVSPLVFDPTPIRVGERAERFVQTFEVCGSALASGGFADRFVAELALGGISIPVTVTDTNDGRYGFSFTPSRGGPWSLAISFDGVPLSGSPYPIVAFDDPPIIPSLPSLTAEASSPSGAAVSFTVPPATDDVDGFIPLTCTPGSASQFALAVTTVSCVAIDSSSQAVSATFTVTVVDTTAPTLSNVPGDQLVEATGPGGTAVDWTPPIATDMVSEGVPVSCTPQAGSLFPMATNVVQCTATDGAGNAAVASFEVSVVDTTGPVIDVASSSFAAEATGPAGAEVVYALPTASDVVDGPVAVSCSPPPGTTFPVGTTTVSCGANDALGNTAVALLDVSVDDTTPPSIAVPLDIALPAAGADGSVVSWSPAQGVDTVSGIVPVTCAPAAGSLFPVGTSTVTCTASDSAGNAASAGFTVTVEQDAMPPVIDSVRLTPDHLWPPNGKFSVVGVNVDARDVVDPNPNCVVADVDYNDPSKQTDARITGPLTVELRAKKGPHASVRTYEVTVTCTDSAGNSSSKAATISVVHGGASARN